MADEKKGADAPDGGASAPQKPEPARPGRTIDRRDVLLGLSTVPALGLFGYAWSRQVAYQRAQTAAAEAARPVPPKDLKDVNVALLGAGAQGQVLLDSMLRIPGLRFRAVCDIWAEYNQKRAVNTLRKFKHDVRGYEDYREMLDKEKDLDAVVIATPDFWHSPHTVDCLKAGKHVYCEKEMSNTLEGARAMVVAARETGKLLQIGHQRRSNPRYLHCKGNLLDQAKVLGRVVTVNGQWNRAVSPDLGWPERYPIPDDRLKQYGFKDMHQFRNWRWFKGKGGGPIVDLGSHQIDIYNWFLGKAPSSVIASGGLDYHDPATHEWYDTVMAIYEYDTPSGKVRAYYQTQTTNGSQGYFENFMGDQGTLLISESEANNPGCALPRPERPRVGRVGPEGVDHGPAAPGEEGEAGGRGARRARVRLARHAPRAGRAARPVPPAAPAELLRLRPGHGAAALPGRGGLRVGGHRAEGQRGDRGETATVLQAGGLPGMNGETNLTRAQLGAVVLLRVLIGWHFLYEGIAKLSAPAFSAAGFLTQSRGPFAPLFHALAGNATALGWSNLMTEWGLVAIGLGLIVGCFTRLGRRVGHPVRPPHLLLQPALRRLLLLDPDGGQLSRRQQEPGRGRRPAGGRAHEHGPGGRARPSHPWPLPGPPHPCRDRVSERENR